MNGINHVTNLNPCKHPECEQMRREVVRLRALLDERGIAVVPSAEAMERGAERARARYAGEAERLARYGANRGTGGASNITHGTRR